MSQPPALPTTITEFAAATGHTPHTLYRFDDRRVDAELLVESFDLVDSHSVAATYEVDERDGIGIDAICLPVLPTCAHCETQTSPSWRIFSHLEVSTLVVTEAHLCEPCFDTWIVTFPEYSDVSGE